MPVTSPVLVGRSAESEQLAAVLREVAAGGRATVLVGGDAGIGKTRLVATTAEDARSAGFTVLVGRCVDLGPDRIGLLPIIEALRPLVADAATSLAPVRGELGTLFPELGRPAGAEIAPSRVTELIAYLLRDAAERAPVLLLLEDLHWADASTRAVVEVLARVAPARVGVIGTYRSDDLHRRHPLRPLLAELDRGHLVTRIQLDPLSVTAVERLMTTLLGHPPEPTLVARVVGRTEGIPLYVEELVADPDSVLPERLGNLLLARTDQASPLVREILKIVAIAGRITSAEVLAELLGGRPAEIIATLREAVGSRLLVADEDGSYAFRHALVREAVYDDLLPQERLDGHRRYAAVLEQHGDEENRTPRAIGELAYHYYAGHELSAALRLAVRAGDAQAHYAPQEALEHYEHALAAWDQMEDAASRAGLSRVRLLSRAAVAAGEIALHARAEQHARAALAQGETEPDRISHLYRLVARARLHAADPAGADEALREAVRAAGDGPALVHGLVDQSVFQFCRMRLTDAEQLAARAETVAAGSGADRTKARLRRADALSWLGRPGEALSMLVPMYDELASGLLPSSRQGFVDVVSSLAEAHQHAGDPARACEVLDEGGDRLASVDVAGADEVTLLTERAQPLLLLGRWDELREVLERAFTLAPRGSQVAVLHAAAGTLATRTGDLDAARPHLEAATAHWRRIGLMAFGAGDFADLAELLLAGGDAPAAAATASEALELLAGSEAALFTARLACALFRARAGTEDDRLLLDRLDAYDRAGGFPSGGPAQAHLRTARALADRAPESAAAAWRAVLHAWQGIGAPYQEAQARFELGCAVLIQGDRQGAAEHLRAAAETAGALGAVPLRTQVVQTLKRARLSPAETARAAADTFGLTTREREVLGLVAQGLTNQAIAGSLFISEKTAGVHVSNILGKLGVANRTAATARAREVGLLADVTGDA